MKKFSTCLLLIFLSTTLFAQNGKAQKKVEQSVNEINALLMAENEELALSDSQKAQIKDLMIQKSQEVADHKKSDKSEDKEALKVIMKKYNTKIFNETLTKEQMTAYRKAKNKNKEN